MSRKIIVLNPFIVYRIDQLVYKSKGLVFFKKTIAGPLATSPEHKPITDSRNVALSFSWRFGKAIRGQRKHEVNGAQSEQNRVRN
jgi:hypothetical protein